MIHLQNRHPYLAITELIFQWIECLLRADYTAADNLVDQFEGDSRIGDYFAITDEIGPMKAVDPHDADWWQISFNPSRRADGAILVEAEVPLARDYRSLRACFIFIPEVDSFRSLFQYCKPS